MTERHTPARAGVRHRDRRGAVHLNAASPWVIDTREVGRRPGSMRRYERTAPISPGLGYGEVISAPPGADVDLQLRAESVIEGVLISGSATVAVRGECSRCLDEVTDEVTAAYSELFAYPDSATDSTTQVDDVSRIVDDLIDIQPVVHDALLLAMPQAPLCEPDCLGLCPECGGRRADLGPDHGHETIDPRWAGLTERFGQPGDASYRNEEN